MNRPPHPPSFFNCRSFNSMVLKQTTSQLKKGCWLVEKYKLRLLGVHAEGSQDTHKHK